MALVLDQNQQSQELNKHLYYCRICHKGFACGRALGGHMRAHGIISDESFNLDQEQEQDQEDDRLSYDDWSTPNDDTTKPIYSLRTNPNRLKSCRICENCGKEFNSWKSFLEHGKCTSDETDSDIEDQSNLEQASVVVKKQHNNNWSKRKRSFRAKVGSIINPNYPLTTTTEEEDLAHCLMMLSNGIVELEDSSCGSATRNFYNSYSYNKNNHQIIQSEKSKLVNTKGLFECKACKKVFNSHQALGGHRASHKKVKGCFAAKLDHHNQNNEESMVTAQEELYQSKINNQYDHDIKKKSKVHECSICYRVFSSGQALGGHKRCHWITSKNINNSTDHYNHGVAASSVGVNVVDSRTLDLTLDLNFNGFDDKMMEKKEISQEIYLLPWEESEKKTKMEDERERKIAKLIEFKEMNTSESSSPWLQVGLVSTTSQPGSDAN